MKLKVLLICFGAVLAGLTSFAQGEQDSILLLNGRVFRGEITAVNDSLVWYKETDKKGNSFSSEMATYRIFSYTQNGISHTLYQQNEDIGNFLTVDEARNATLGSYDARQTFKPRVVFWSSLALGYTATIFDTYLQQSTLDSPNYVGNYSSPGLFKSKPTVFPFFVPLVLAVSWGLPSFRVKENQIIQKQLLNDPSYYRGYHRVAKQKRMLGALKGSLIGIGTGLVTYAILKP